MYYLISRRDFLKLTGIFASTIAFGGLFSSCALRVPTELRSVSKGFSPYNRINPYIPVKQRQTFLDNIREHKPAWAGAQYHRRLNEPIVAPADGIIDRCMTKKGYHGIEDEIVIDHGGTFSTRFIHCNPYSAKKAGMIYGKQVKRGQVIGRAQGLPLKTSMYFCFILGDMDDYGEHLSYMKYWDGTPLDYDYLEIGYRKKHHLQYISELKERYFGPGADLLKEVSRSVPRTLNHDSKGYFTWSSAKFFKFLEQIFINNPEFFKGNRSDNHKLIQNIYNTQPVVLTLPFKPRKKLFSHIIPHLSTPPFIIQS